MMAYSFLNLAIDVLKNKKVPLSVDEIWSVADELDLKNKVASNGKTPVATLSAKIYVDIKTNNDSDFIKVGKRPVRFFLKSLGDFDKESIENVENLVFEEDLKISDDKVKERELHTLLTEFVYSNPHFRCYTKTIYHETSIKRQKGYNKWLHPDIVGVYFPFEDYTKETQLLQESFRVNPFKLYSFEMKIKVSLSNLRECYFQAVSNSSWANEGYLVALEFDEDKDLINELRRLNNSFGIGVIKLNKKEAESSEILLPAKQKEFLDWETMDRLVVENSDFKKFISDIMDDIKVKKVKSTYDK